MRSCLQLRPLSFSSFCGALSAKPSEEPDPDPGRPCHGCLNCSSPTKSASPSQLVDPNALRPRCSEVIRFNSEPLYSQCNNT
ncbi:hypothetical protein BGY98DRAFT_657853 [Russula aff. rugulosa BPL654]|nr:hypothetical protein BGY98DRAFT_657853 [Russula aff. rugulosa BPL654]